jgi:hypothetical protein
MANTPSMIPCRNEIFGFIEAENCELLGAGRWEFHEICRGIADHYLTPEELASVISWTYVRNMIWKCYLEHKDKQMVEVLVGTNGNYRCPKIDCARRPLSRANQHDIIFS